MHTTIDEAANTILLSPREAVTPELAEFVRANKAAIIAADRALGERVGNNEP